MLTHTFNIGEYAKGGVISVNIKGNNITIIGREWDYSKGMSKKSDQSKAKEFIRCTINSNDLECRQKLDAILMLLTTLYYTREIFNWIEDQIKIN